MADALTPWFLDYVLSIAETYGANISDVPCHAKGKKVQITEFLTYDSEEEDNLLWALISDKQYTIPVKFTKNAVAQYALQNTTSKRFTRHKTALITIKNFKLIFTRVPLGTPGTMSSEPSLAIECLLFSILGSSGEAIFGNPKPITVHPDLHQWSECLKRDGGAGNILKDRKLRRQVNDSAGVVQPPTALPERPRRSPVFKRNIDQPVPCARDNSSIVSYMHKWQVVERTHEYRRLPQTINAPPPDRAVRTSNNGLALASDLENGDAPSNAQRCPPDLPEVPLTEPDPSNVAFSSSSIPAPTPAQRMKTSNIHEQESHLPMGHEPRSRKSDNPMAQLVSRKVPRPISPVPHDHTDSIIRVLAPDSNAGSSQPISQTQNTQLSQLSHVQAETTIDNEKSQALLQGITVDLKAKECPFLDLLRVREILERAHRHRNATDVIFVDSFHVSANIGPDCWDRGRPQPIEISVYLHLKESYLDRAGASDNVLDTVDYSDLTKKFSNFIKAKSGSDTPSFSGPDELIKAVTEQAFDLAGEAASAVRVTVEAPKMITLAAGFSVDITIVNDQSKSIASKKVLIKDLVLPVIIGVNPAAKQRVNLIFHENTSSSSASASSTVVNYQQVVAQLCQEIESSSCLTLEAFVMQVLKTSCMCSDRIEAVTVRAQNPSALSFAESSGVEITRKRNALGDSLSSLFR